jgi:Ca-activated chloride channel homolog
MPWLVAKYHRFQASYCGSVITYLLPVLLACLLTPTAMALRWQDLWLTPDQQGQKALQAQHAELAATRFADPLWRAVAAYRAQNYQRCADLLRDKHSALAYYNRGNALAKLGQYSSALAAYEQALKLAPHDKQAKDNRDLMQKLLQQPPSSTNESAAGQRNQDLPNAAPSASTQTANNAQTAADNAPPPTPPANNSNQTTKGKSFPDRAATAPTPDKTAANDSAKDHSSNPIKQQSQVNAKPSNHNQSQAQPATIRPQPLSQAQRALSRIDDDPGSLLRQKFLRDYDKIQQGK